MLHDVINDRFARKAIEKGADGLIAVAAGAGGHAGTLSPFALVQEIRQWFDGPLALSGAIASGASVASALAAGADFGYVGSAFVATREANAVEGYKRAIVDGDASQIVYTSLFTGVHGEAYAHMHLHRACARMSRPLLFRMHARQATICARRSSLRGSTRTISSRATRRR